MSKFKIITLRCDNSQNINTELHFEIASARAERCEVVAIQFDNTVEKNETTIISSLKKMKTAGAIQFFAIPESFKLGNTESVFLLNKYPDVFSSVGENCYNNIYVKL